MNDFCESRRRCGRRSCWRRVSETARKDHMARVSMGTLWASVRSQPTLVVVGWKAHNTGCETTNNLIFIVLTHPEVTSHPLR